jgi:polar amino acid transport system substrate-binding protein
VTPPADVDGGFEHGIAAALADRFDLDLRIVDVSFDRLVAGDLRGADLARAQITRTDERAEHVAFSTPYYVDDAGVVLPAGEERTDLETARERSWAVERGSVQEQFVVETIRPDVDPVVFDDAVATIDAVAGGRVDGALVDLSTALGLTDGRDDVTTSARFATHGEMAVAMPTGSVNVEVVDAALRGLEADRTIGDLEAEYLAPVFAAAPDSRPVIRTPDD